MDGNFSAEHMAMRRPQDDIALTDGAGYMVAPGPYKTHLSIAKESSQVMPQSRFIVPSFADVPSVALQMQQPQGCQPSQLQPPQSGSDRHRCNCMCKTWLLLSSLGRGLPEG